MHIRLADLHNPSDQRAVLELLDMYAREPMGDSAPLPADVRERLIPGLQQQANCRTFLAYLDGRPVALAICFLGFSTFRAQPLMNIHDLAVAPDCRGQGIGRALLYAIEQEARRCGCCRLTLEVRADNASARHLYTSFGFDPGCESSAALSFWKKNLD